MSKILRCVVSIRINEAVLFVLKVTFRPVAASATISGRALEIVFYVCGLKITI
jgi:hypothetical protein